MLGHLIRKRVRKHAARSAPVTAADIQAAASMLFAVFARYGDTVIAYKTIRELMRAFPHKRYLLITSRQSLPYARALLPKEIEIIGISWRRNPIRLWRLARRLRRAPPDLGFNPWSHGTESEFFASFARRFFLYRQFAGFERTYNLYRRIREYLGLPEGAAHLQPRTPATVRRILIAPFSTDLRKSLGHADLARLLAAARALFPGAECIVTGLPGEIAAVRGHVEAQWFALGKTRRHSERFLALLQATDLFIGVDAGPLHLADALGLPTVGIFGPTAPETILDRDSGIVALRHPVMRGVFCDIMSCRDPLCLHRLCTQLDLEHGETVPLGQVPTLEKSVCRAL
jgi:ADP-heptose:LPS heptosyltransferase